MFPLLLLLLLLIIIIVISSSSRSVFNFRIQVLSIETTWRFRRVVHKIDMTFNPSSKPKNAVLKCPFLLFHSLQMSVSTQCSPDGVLSPVCLSGSTSTTATFLVNYAQIWFFFFFNQNLPVATIFVQGPAGKICVRCVSTGVWLEAARAGQQLAVGLNGGFEHKEREKNREDWGNGTYES